jgi:uncharacterized protein with NAD-binding domain and iron-sulfur cluster
VAEGDRAETKDRTKVAILGGGPGALAAAYYLTTLEPAAYDITIYEMSWRLGGKTASGRGESGRIEEHGLHVLFGGYHNAFDMMLGCYDALAKAGHPLPFRRFFDALVWSDFGAIGDERFEKWDQWDLQFPVNWGVPGDPPLPTTWDLVSGLSQVVIHVVLGGAFLRFVQRRLSDLIGHPMSRAQRERTRARDTPGDGGDWFVRGVLIPGFIHMLDTETRIGRACLRLAEIAHRIVHGVERLVRPRLIRFTLPGRIWTGADVMLATWKGLSKGRVLSTPDGYQRMDRWDLREWLGLHGARHRTLRSPLVRIIYDAAFSYPEGGRDPEGSVKRERNFLKQSMAAGAALRIMFWMAFTFKGAMYFKMRAGMGDVIHVPLYRFLKSNNVRFKFFHKVRGLRPAENGETIDEIELERLARPLDGHEYDPLVVVKGFECWPAKPDTDQLLASDRDDAEHAEEFFYRPKSRRPVVLRRRGSAAVEGATSGDAVTGEFDKIIFGIPVACIPFVCEDLVRDGRKNWDKQSKVGTTQTVALQLWCKYSLRELGWRDPPPLLSLFFDPLNTWCDMGQVQDREHWPEDHRPSMLAYFCGPLPHHWTPEQEKGRWDPAYDALWRQELRTQAERARDDLFSHLSCLWPAFGTAHSTGHPQVQNWNILFDPANRAGKGRIGAQYLRPNFDPHERCTLALPEESENRMRPDDTGFANLTVAGDWTANELLAACFEGAVQGGIRAARAISEEKALYRIIGENLLNPGQTLGRSAAQSAAFRPGGRSPPPG